MRPGFSLALAGSRVERELHRADRAGHVPEQLARVRDARIRRKVRPHAGHRVEAAKAFSVAPELDERIADHAVVACGGRRDRTCATAENERLAEAVPRERERTEPAGRDQVTRREPESAMQ